MNPPNKPETLPAPSAININDPSTPQNIQPASLQPILEQSVEETKTLKDVTKKSGGDPHVDSSMKIVSSELKANAPKTEQIIPKGRHRNTSQTDNGRDDVSRRLEDTRRSPNNRSSKGSFFETVSIGPEMFISLKKGDLKNFYNVGKSLGEGAYGKVCLATHKTTNMVRAMKTVKKSQVVREKEHELFNEVAILKLLDHPNIIKLFELFQDETHYFLITEYAIAFPFFPPRPIKFWNPILCCFA